MSIKTETTGNKARIAILGLFNASIYKDFKHTGNMLMTDNKVEIIEIDLSSTEYLDSAALGMLVQLNEKAKYAKKTVTLISIPGRVSQILKIANADKLFTVNLPTGIKMNLTN